MSTLSHISGPRGLERLRYLKGFLGDPYEMLLELHERYGPVCRIGAFSQEYVILFGTKGNELLLNDSPLKPKLKSRDVLKVLIPVVGSTAMVVSDGAEHRRRRSLVKPAFTHRRIESCAPTMSQEVNAMIDSWTPGMTLNVFNEARSCIRRIAIRCLFGERLEEQADLVGERLEVALRYINRSPFLRLDLDLPGTPYHRAKVARAEVDALVQKEISTRAEEPDRGDVLDALLQSRDDHGGGLDDLEVKDQVISLIASGYDSSSAAAGWAVYALLKHPEALRRVREEVHDVAGDGPLEPRYLRRMPYLGWTVSESLRLYTPGVITGRTVTTDIEFEGVHIPAGTRVLYSQYVTHRMPDLWPRPYKFDPERWNTDSPTYTAPLPYSYIPFGGGYRMCIGFAFAKLELGILLAELASRVDLELLNNDIRPMGVATMWPRGGIPTRVTSITERRHDARRDR